MGHNYLVVGKSSNFSQNVGLHGYFVSKHAYFDVFLEECCTLFGQAVELLVDKLDPVDLLLRFSKASLQLYSGRCS